MTKRIDNVEIEQYSTPLTRRRGFSVSSLMAAESLIKNQTGTLNIATVFSGIGTPEYSLNRGGWNHKVIFACERDKYARETYELNFGKPLKYYTDIILLDAKKYYGIIDCLFGGSPCQAFSIAGKRGGFEDTRGTLFYEYARVLKESAAPSFVYENVKGMTNHDKPKVSQFALNIHKNKNYYTWEIKQLNFKLVSEEYFNLNKETKSGIIHNNKYYKAGYPSLVNKEYDGIKKGIGRTLHIVENTFRELGYYFQWKILNTKEHGVPQNRERIYIVGFRDELYHNKFKFKAPEELKIRLLDILEDEVDEKYLLSDKLVKEYKNHGTASQFKSSQAGKVCDLNEKDFFHTINSGPHGYSMGFLKYDKDAISFAQRGRYSETAEASSIRQVGRRLSEDGKRDDYNYSINTKQQFEFRTDGVANCISTVQKDSMVCIKKPISLADGLIEVENDLIKVKEAVVTTGIKLEQTHIFNIKGNDSIKRIYAANGLSPSLTTCSGGHREPKVSINKISICDDTQGFDGVRNYQNFSPSLRANRNGLKWQQDDYIFRKLTPRECFRLQGFGDDFKFSVSDTQAYKQAGNSMSANITSIILDEICNILGIQKNSVEE